MIRTHFAVLMGLLAAADGFAPAGVPSLRTHHHARGSFNAVFACRVDSRVCTTASTTDTTAAAATTTTTTSASTTTTTTVVTKNLGSRGTKVPGGEGGEMARPSAALTARRSFLVAAASVLLLGEGDIKEAAAASAKASGVPSQAVVQAAAKDIEALIADDPKFGPTLVRLAWHSSGTYDRMTKTGGSSKGTIRFDEELKHGANAGLEQAVAKLQPVMAKNPGISFADLCTLSGVVAVRALGGPTVGWRGGRVDAMDPSEV
jgi:hypothetical protein